MNNEWTVAVTAIGTLMGAGLGGFLVNLGSKRQFRRQQQWQRDQFLQEKLKEIAAVTEDLETALRKLCGDAIVRIHDDQPFEISQPIPVLRLRILLDFYAPELIAEYEEIINIRDTLSRAVSKVIIERPLGKDIQQQLTLEFLEGSQRATGACAALAKRAADLARTRLGLHLGKRGQSRVALI